MVHDLYRCQKCGKEVTSFFNIWSIFYIFSSNKKCQNCFTKIQFNALTFLLYYIGFPIFLFSAAFSYFKGLTLLISYVEPFADILNEKNEVLVFFLVLSNILIILGFAFAYFHIITNRFNCRLFDFKQEREGPIT